MKRFVVVTEEYKRFGFGSIDVDLYEAEDFAALAELLGETDSTDLEERGSVEEQLKHFKSGNGDGANYYIVHELIDGIKLGPNLMEIKD